MEGLLDENHTVNEVNRELFSITMVPGEPGLCLRRYNYDFSSSILVYRTESEWLDTSGLSQVKEILKSNEAQPTQVEWAARAPPNHGMHWLYET
jgi:hypothetical protein